VGAEVGNGVSDLVGFVVGTQVGDLEGRRVGRLVGDRVGDLLGAGVTVQGHQVGKCNHNHTRCRR
jgi:hypothetical protein